MVFVKTQHPLNIVIIKSFLYWFRPQRRYSPFLPPTGITNVLIWRYTCHTLVSSPAIDSDIGHFGSPFPSVVSSRSTDRMPSDRSTVITASTMKADKRKRQGDREEKSSARNQVPARKSSDGFTSAMRDTREQWAARIERGWNWPTSGRKKETKR